MCLSKLFKPREVIKTVYTGELRDFRDLAELTAWATANYEAVDGDCDDYARRFREKATKAGYYMSLAYVYHSRYYNTPMEFLGPDSAHVGCSAILGNEVYYVDPVFEQIVHLTALD